LTKKISLHFVKALAKKQLGATLNQSFWLVLLMFGLALSDSFAQSKEEAARSIDAISKQINSISEALNTNKQQRQSEQNKLYIAEKSISANYKSLENLEEKIRAQTAQAKATQQQITALQTQSEAIAKNLINLIRDQYIQGSDAYVKQLLNQQNPYALGRLNHYRSIFREAMMGKIKELSFITNGLEEQRLAYTELLTQLEADQRSLYSKQAELLSNKSKREKVIATLDTQLSDKATRLKTLNEDRARLKTLLQQIEQQANQLSKLAPRPTRALVPGGFKQQKGRLRYPVDGKVITAFGARIPTSGIRSNGLYFESKQSAKVRSIYTGTVIFSDYLKGFGELIIVDHGDDHISLYGHNERLLKRLGDPVQANEVIAQVGTSGGLKQPGLYFEIRQNTQAINPTVWFEPK
jgi:septal ring factor EnvC (AmiA/AmiB activator)